MRNAIAVLLILAVAVGWFSAYGPREAVDGSGMGPGDDRAGASPIAVSGAGAEIATITVAQDGEIQEPEETQAPAREEQTGVEAPEEEHMDNVSALIWYVIGVMTVLIGEFAGVVVACAWQRLHKENKEEMK